MIGKKLINLRNYLFKCTLSTLALVVLIVLAGGNCGAQNTPPQQRQHENEQPITSKQINEIKSILSHYKASTLTPEQVSEINEKFRSAGIYPSPQIKDAILAAGFDPDKFRPSGPQQMNNPGGGMGAPQNEDHMKMIHESVMKPLSLSADQKVKITKIFSDFFSEIDVQMHGMGNQMPDRANQMPDRAKIEPIEKARDAKIKKVLSKEQYEKYIKMELAPRPPKRGENIPHQKHRK